MNKLRLLLAAPLFCVPFLAHIHAEPLVAFHHEWLAAACGLLVLPAFLTGQRAGTTNIPVVVALPALLITLLFTQMAMDMIVYPSQGRAAILCLMLAAWVMIATRNLMYQFSIGRLAVVIAWALLVGGLLQGIAAVLQYWSIHTVLDPLIAARTRLIAYGNLAQANHFADYQSLSLAALVFLAAGKRLPPWTSPILGMFLLFGLALSGARSSWLYLFAFAGLAYVLHRRVHSDKSRQMILFSLFALAAYFVLQVLLGFLQDASVTANSRILANSYSALDSRLPMWSSALKMFASAPLLGVGFQNYSWQFFLDHAWTSSSPTNAHNLVMHMLAEFGLGGGVFTVMLGYWLFRALARLATVEQWLVLSLTIVLLIHSMLEFPLHYLHFMLPGAALLALLNEDSRSLSISDRLMRPLTLLLFAAGTAILFSAFSSYAQLTLAYADFSADRVVLDQAKIERLLKIQGSSLYEPEAENLLNSLRVTNKNLELLPSLLAVSARQVQQKAGASRVFRHVLLLGLSYEEEEAERLLALAVHHHPEQLEEFRTKLDELRAEFPIHTGLSTLHGKLATLTTGSPKQAVMP